MIQDRERRIRERAYTIWQSEGCPGGCADDHWRRAEREIAAEERATARDALSLSDAGPSDAAAAVADIDRAAAADYESATGADRAYPNAARPGTNAVIPSETAAVAREMAPEEAAERAALGNTGRRPVRGGRPRKSSP